MIGSKFWKYDGNFRHYVNDNGVKQSGPVYSKSFREYTVIGETSRSWLLSQYEINLSKITDRDIQLAIKVPKKEGFYSYGFLNDLEKMQDSWINENKHKLATQILELKTYSILKRIEEILLQYQKDKE